jgi:hypothetical protein
MEHMTMIKVGDYITYIGDVSKELYGRSGKVVDILGEHSCVVNIDGMDVGVAIRNLRLCLPESPNTYGPDDIIPAYSGDGSSGMKYDGGKARMALLFDGCPNALEAVGQVLTFGAQKYAAHSWQTVPEGDERYKSALLRHLLAVGKGEVIDPESNLHHLAHAACNALFILELELRKQNA